jgi:hypothetical protein
MKINFAHIRERSTTGDWINIAVFDARSTVDTASANAELLAGYKVDKSALAFSDFGHLKFYGAKNLIDYLARNGAPQWTRQLEV